MCLAQPGRILAIAAQSPQDSAELPAGAEPPLAPPPQLEDPLWRVAVVDFGGVRQQVSLACLPEARVGDRVLVHVGLALSLVEEEETS